MTFIICLPDIVAIKSIYSAIFVDMDKLLRICSIPEGRLAIFFTTSQIDF